MAKSRTVPRWVPIGFIAAVGLLTAASFASACLAQATLQLSKTAARPGTTVTGTGYGFNGGRMTSGGNYGDVQVRWKRIDGRVLWAGQADSNQSVAFSFKVPRRAKPGYYVVVATQLEEDGTPAYGTPARTTLKVRKAQ